VVAQYAVFQDLIPCGSKMNGPRGIRRPVDKKEWFTGTSPLFNGFIRVVGVPVFLHPTLYQLRIEVGGDFLHKTPLE
jgi:hypothetical protein